MKCILDIETNGLLDEATNVHCIVAYDIDGKKPYVFKGDECRADVKLLLKIRKHKSFSLSK